MSWWDSFADGAGDVFDDILGGAKKLVNGVGDVTGALNNVIGSDQPSETPVKVPVKEVVKETVIKENSSFFEKNKELLLIGGGLLVFALVLKR